MIAAHTVWLMRDCSINQFKDIEFIGVHTMTSTRYIKNAVFMFSYLILFLFLFSFSSGNKFLFQAQISGFLILTNTSF